MEGSTPRRPGTGRNRTSRDASPALVVEKLTGIAPAGAVSMSEAEEDAGGRVGCCGVQAITPSRGGGVSTVHVQLPFRSTHPRKSRSGASIREARRATTDTKWRTHRTTIQNPREGPAPHLGRIFRCEGSYAFRRLVIHASSFARDHRSCGAADTPETFSILARGPRTNLGNGVVVTSDGLVRAAALSRRARSRGPPLR
jgi:hypothetical protein